MKKIAIITMMFCCGILLYFVWPKSVSIEVEAATAYMSLEEMVVKADLITEVNVKSLEDSEWDTDANGEQIDQMHTDANVQPVEIYSDDMDGIQTISETEELTVRTDVGQIGNTVQTSSGLPSLEENETALLFLVEESDDTGTYYSILGNSQGKFTKQEIDGELCYTNGRDQLPVEGLQEKIQQIAEDNKDTQWASDYYTDEEIKAMNDALFKSGAE